MLELDAEMVNELLDSFHELYEQVDADLSILAQESNTERLNSVFRGIHTIKGHAAIMQLGALVNFTHALEEVAESLRSRKFRPTKSICEVMQLSMDRLRDLHYRDLKGQKFADLLEHQLEKSLLELSQTADEYADTKARSIIEAISGGNNEAAETTDQEGDFHVDHDVISVPSFSFKGSDRQLLDLAFFQELSFQCDRQTPYWVDRSIQLYDWAQKLNHWAGDPVEYKQLAAAAYMHDIGMSFLPHELRHKTAKLTEQERMDIQRHVSWGYDFLIRMPRWEEAALIVLNHHERADGMGYPNRLMNRLIHPGAKILAVVDAFFSIINGRADRTQRRSVIRAISEINSGAGTQFDEYWVGLFNEVVRTEVRRGVL